MISKKKLIPRVHSSVVQVSGLSPAVSGRDHAAHVLLWPGAVRRLRIADWPKAGCICISISDENGCGVAGAGVARGVAPWAMAGSVCVKPDRSKLAYKMLYFIAARL